MYFKPALAVGRQYLLLEPFFGSPTATSDAAEVRRAAF